MPPSRSRPFRLAESLAASLLLSTLCACAAFTTRTGREAREYENNVGLEFARQAEQILPIFDEFEVFEFFNTVGAKVVSAVENRQFAYKIFLIKDSVFNAFAVPGGFVYLYSGLVLRFDTVDQLAAALSHEIAHVEGHHFLHRQKKASITSLTTLAAAILAAVFFPEHGGAIATTAIAADMTLQLNYSREQEEEADRMGLRYQAASGFRIEGMAEMFEKFREIQRLNLGEVPPYFLTHPLATKRLEYVRLARDLVPRNGARPELDDAFERTKAIMRGRIGPAVEVLALYQERIDEAPDNPDAWHLLGTAAAYSGELAEAERAFTRTVELDPGNASARADLGRLFITQGRLDEADDQLMAASELDPDSGHLQIDFGSLYEARGDLDGASQFYRRAVKQAPSNPEAHQRLGMVLGKLDRFEQAHYHMGVGHKLQWRIGKALLHLTKALDLCRNDPEQTETINEMIRELTGSR